MTGLNLVARAAAAAVAVVAWAGLVIQSAATWEQVHSVSLTIWVMLRYFTIWTNLLLAVVMTLEALGASTSPFMRAGVALAMALVGIVYATLLRGLLHLSGGALLADTLLHTMAPVGAVLWWLLFAPKGALGRWDPPRWALYPLVYFGYAMVRGAVDGRYPYPFVDVAALGWGRVLINAVAIAIGFLVAGYLLLGLDAALQRRRDALLKTYS